MFVLGTNENRQAQGVFSTIELAKAAAQYNETLYNNSYQLIWKTDGIYTDGDGYWIVELELDRVYFGDE